MDAEAQREAVLAHARSSSMGSASHCPRSGRLWSQSPAPPSLGSLGRAGAAMKMRSRSALTGRVHVAASAPRGLPCVVSPRRKALSCQSRAHGTVVTSVCSSTPGFPSSGAFDILGWMLCRGGLSCALQCPWPLRSTSHSTPLAWQSKCLQILPNAPGDKSAPD